MESMGDVSNQLEIAKTRLAEAPLGEVIGEIDKMYPGTLVADIDAYESKVEGAVDLGAMPVNIYAQNVTHMIEHGAELFDRTAKGSGVDGLLASIQYVEPMKAAAEELADAAQEAGAATQQALAALRLAKAQLESAVAARERASQLADGLNAARAKVIAMIERLQTELR